jgi:hypothetical protein
MTNAKLAARSTIPGASAADLATAAAWSPLSATYWAMRDVGGHEAS